MCEFIKACPVNGLSLVTAINKLFCILAFAAMVVFPSSLTEEEEALQKKYAKLRKKVHRL